MTIVFNSVVLLPQTNSFDPNKLIEIPYSSNNIKTDGKLNDRKTFFHYRFKDTAQILHSPKEFPFSLDYPENYESLVKMPLSRNTVDVYICWDLDYLNIAYEIKDFGQNILFKRFVNIVNSRINNKQKGYVIEQSIPLSSIGLQAINGINFKLDICNNDVDFSLKNTGIIEEVKLHTWSFDCIGYNNFGFPGYWKKAIFSEQQYYCIISVHGIIILLFTRNILGEISTKSEIILSLFISNNILPVELSNKGLITSIHNFCKKIQMSKQININLEDKTNAKRFDISTELILYRVIQELMNTSLKHANAENIYLEFFLNNDELRLLYQDDGNGFDVVEQLNDSTGIGLSNLYDRIKSLWGELKFTSEKGLGTNVTIKINI